MGVLVVEPFKRLNFVHQGFILKFKFIFLPPPPPHFLISIFSQLKFIIMRVCEPQAKNCLPFFCNFVYFKSIGEKICIIFTNWRKNIHFLPFFLSPFNYFFPQLLYGHIFGVKQNNVSVCQPLVTVGLYAQSVLFYSLVRSNGNVRYLHSLNTT